MYHKHKTQMISKYLELAAGSHSKLEPLDGVSFQVVEIECVFIVDKVEFLQVSVEQLLDDGGVEVLDGALEDA